MKYLSGKKTKIMTCVFLFSILLFISSCSSMSRDVFSEDAHQRAISAGVISQVEASDGSQINRNLVEVGFSDIVHVQDNVRIDFDASTIRNLYFEHDDVRLLDVYVSLNQEVSKGDILAVAEFDTREIEAEIEVLLLSVERHELAFERDLRQHQRILREMRATRDLITDPNEMQTQNLRIQRQQLILDNFTQQSERSLEIYNTRIDELSELLEGDKIIAPFDGVIVMIRDSEGGSVFRSHDVMLRIIDPARLQFVVTSDIGLIRFGDTFQAVLQNNNYEFEAIVVSDPIATDTREDTYTFVLQPVDRAAFWNDFRHFGIEFSALHTLRIVGSPIRHNINNVLSIPRSALNEHDDDVYVLIYENGEIMPRFIDIGFSDDDNVQVLSGLVEGQKVVR